MKPESSTPCCDEESKSTRPWRCSIKKPNVSLKCSICQRRFPSFVRLQRHLNLFHKTNGKVFWCSRCSLAFNDISALVRHSRTRHQEVNPDDDGGQHGTLLEEAVIEPSVHVEGISRAEEETQKPSTERNLTEYSNEDGVSRSHQELDEVVLRSEVIEAERGDFNIEHPDNVQPSIVTVTVPISQSDFTEDGTKDARTYPGSDSKKSTRKRSQTFKVYDQSFSADRSLLSGHPTMANIGKTLPSNSECPFPVKSQRLSRQEAGRRGSRISRQIRRPVSSQSPNRRTSDHYPAAQNLANASKDELNLSIPGTVKTVNLVANTGNADLEAKTERTEILTYLRTVNAKLDAVIRHFNVPFLELGSGLLPPIITNFQNQHTQHKEMEFVNESSDGNIHGPQKMSTQNQSESNMIGSSRGSVQRFQEVIDTPNNRSVQETTFQQGTIITRDNTMGITSPVSNSLEPLCYDTESIRLSEETVQDIHSKSLNRGNFAKQLVFRIFSPLERRGKNCFGRRAGVQSGPKAPLDPAKMQFVREKVFQYFPCEVDREESIWRRQCVIAVDTALRGENRPHKKIVDFSSRPGFS